MSSAREPLVAWLSNVSHLILVASYWSLRIFLKVMECLQIFSFAPLQAGCLGQALFLFMDRTRARDRLCLQLLQLFGLRSADVYISLWSAIYGQPVSFIMPATAIILQSSLLVIDFPVSAIVLPATLPSFTEPPDIG